MEKPAAVICTASLLVLSLATVCAQETREPAIAGMHHVDFKEMDSTYTMAARMLRSWWMRR